MNTENFKFKETNGAKPFVSGSAIMLMIILLWAMWFLAVGGLKYLLGDMFVIRCILIFPFTMLTIYISRWLWHYR